MKIFKFKTKRELLKTFPSATKYQAGPIHKFGPKFMVQIIHSKGHISINIDNVDEQYIDHGFKGEVFGYAMVCVDDKEIIYYPRHVLAITPEGYAA